MYLDLQQVKQHLIIDHNDDNQYLADLITVAEDVVRRDLNVYSPKELEDCGGMLPASVLHAMLLLVGTFYANRETVTYGNVHVVPHSYEYLIALARNYINKA